MRSAAAYVRALASTWVLAAIACGDPTSSSIRFVETRTGSTQAALPRYRVSVADGALRFVPRARNGDAATLRLQTSAMRCGASVLRVDAETVIEDDQLTWSRGDVVERIALSEAGLEQSWQLAHAPCRDGDWSITIDVRGQTYAGRSSRGHHFVDAASGAGTRYGNATFVDARGRSSPVAITWKDDALVLRVSRDVLATSAYPAVLDPLISPELPVDNPATAPQRTEGATAIAWNGTHYLVVWISALDGAAFAARVGADGFPVDDPGIRLGPAAGSSTSAAISWDGDTWMVVWSRYTELRGARVSASGIALDPPDGFEIGVGMQPAIAWNGTHHLLGYLGLPDHSPRAARLTRAGLIDGATVMISTDVFASQVSVASDGDGWLLSFDAGAFPRAARISAEGNLIDAPDGFALSETQGREHAIAFAGSQYLVTWIQPGLPGGHFATRVDRDGNVLDDPPIEIGDYRAKVPVIAPMGDSFLLAYHFDDTPFEHRVRVALVTAAGERIVDSAAPGGALVGSAPSHFAADVDRPAIAAGDTDALVVWRSADTILAARVSASAELIDAPPDDGARRVARHTNEQTETSIAFGGTQYFAAWIDNRPDAADHVYAARIALDGTTLDPSAIAISTSPTPHSHPNVVWNGAEFVVAWLEREGTASAAIRARRIDSGGHLVGGGPSDEGIAIASPPVAAPGTPRLASNGANVLAVWDDARGGGREVFGGRLDSAGTPLDGDGFLVSMAGGGQSSPTVASDGTGYLVAFVDARTGSSRELYATHVTATGDVIDGTGFRLCASASTLSRPAVAWGGSNYLVTFRDGTGARAVRVGLTTEPIDPSCGFSLTSTSAFDLAIAGRDDVFTIAYQPSGALYGARVSAAGTLLEPGFQLLGVSASGSAVALRSGYAGVVAYARRDDTGVERAFVRTFEFLRNGSPCTRDTDCNSRFCTDGVCCDARCGTSTSDCQGCSVMRGAPTDGACALLSPSRVCRASVGECDPAESCTGVAIACPADTRLPGGTPCAPDENPCSADLCFGGSGRCEHYAGNAGATCRPSAGDCDIAEVCTGASTTCPDDVRLAGSVCRAVAGECDAPEVCDGVDAMCPPDAMQPPDIRCRRASCTSSTSTLEAFCTGASADCPAIETVSCAPSSCLGSACPGMCSTDDECGAGAFCSAGVCVGELARGETCARNRECSTAVCASGRCCDTACVGPCVACDVSGLEGVCSVLEGHRCGEPGCGDGSQWTEAVCATDGSCVRAEPTSCSPYACGDGSCLDACVRDGDCAPAFACLLGECVLPSDAGVDADVDADAATHADAAEDATIDVVEDVSSIADAASDALEDANPEDAGNSADGSMRDANAAHDDDDAATLDSSTTDARGEERRGGERSDDRDAGLPSTDGSGCDCSTRPTAPGTASLIALVSIAYLARTRRRLRPSRAL